MRPALNAARRASGARGLSGLIGMTRCSEKAPTMPPHMATQCTPETRPRASMARTRPSPTSDHLGVAGARRALAQVAVEHHADRAHEEASARRDDNPVGRELDQALVLQAP